MKSQRQLKERKKLVEKRCAHEVNEKVGKNWRAQPHPTHTNKKKENK